MPVENTRVGQRTDYDKLIWRSGLTAVWRGRRPVAGISHTAPLHLLFVLQRAGDGRPDQRVAKRT